MRSPTAYRVLLLLLCALADADAVAYLSPRALRAACDKGNIKGLSSNRYDLSTSNELKCKPVVATDKEAIVVKGNRYESIKCDPTSGFWMSGTNKIAAATAEISIECKTFGPCAVQPITGAKLDEQTRKFTCDDTKFRKLIEVGSNRYTSLKCDTVTGWTDGTTPIENPDAAKILEMTCQEYCAYFGKGVDMKETGLKREIACKEDFHRLLFANDEVEGNGATCTVADGWKSKEGAWTAINTQTLNVECKEVCRAETQNGCDGEYVYSRVTCSHGTGWTDANGKKLAEASDVVDLKCAPVTCVHTSTCENVPAGSDCEPLKVTKMDTLECERMQQLYETKLEQYYPSELRCRTVGDDRWHTFEDTNLKGKITIRGRGLNVVCLQKRCNKCTKLATVTDAEFTPGKAGSCAKNTCTLWKVKTKGSSAQQQYAGAISCSSDKATEGKWMTDENAEVDEAECISKDVRETVVKCTEASPLVTNCNANLTSFGCTQITPLDTVHVECPNKKELFIKHPGSQYFIDGTKITCHKATGLWKVERKGERPEQLKRGGIVICADRNPAPPRPMQKPAAKEGDGKTVRLALILCCSVGVVLFIAAIASVIYGQVRCRRGNAY